MSQRIETFDQIGQVVFRKSIRAKRVSLNIKPFKSVTVSIPLRVSYSTARKFFTANLDWVHKTVQNMRHIEQQQKQANKSLPPIDVVKAKIFLRQRLAQLAMSHGFEYNRVFIRNQKTRWGSCSHVNNINLNINLVRLSSDLIDYVILHELVHTKVKNHSKRFWKELNKYVGDSKAIDKKLRNVNLPLHAA